MTVDVEDFCDGMRQRGHPIAHPRDGERGLTSLMSQLEGSAARLTFFVVGNVAERHLPELNELAAGGHEIASHGPDHGDLPEAGARLGPWLRDGRAILEDALQVRVRGFRSPRFELPRGLTLAEFRAEIRRAGCDYVSDTRTLADECLAELPIARMIGGLRIGGGSYQRFLPQSATTHFVRARRHATVLYYHSYDFGRELPRAVGIRSTSIAAQVIGRKRIPKVFTRLVSEFGSRTCRDVVDGLY
jgi:peptidoglycan/xylan/chitin deacetylase (PgdA/CDA1 family)